MRSLNEILKLSASYHSDHYPRQVSVNCLRMVGLQRFCSEASKRSESLRNDLKKTGGAGVRTRIFRLRLFKPL